MNQALIDSIRKDLDALHANDSVKPVYAPFETLGADMVSRLPSVQGEILVISDAGLLVAVLQRLRRERLTFSKVRFLCHTEALQNFGSQLGVHTTLVCYNDLHAWFKEARMEFDIVLQNPPYRYGMDKSFYTKFIALGFNLLKEGGVMCAVTPHTWIRNANGHPSGLMKSLCKKATFSMIHVLEAQSVFDIALGPVSYFVLSKDGSTKDFNEVTMYASDELLHKREDPLFKKIISDWIDLEGGKGSDTEGEGERRFVRDKSDTHAYPVFLSSREDRQACWSDWIAPGAGTPKLIVSYITEPGKSSQFSWFNVDSGVGRYCHFIRCTELEAKNIQGFLDSKTCKYVDSKGRNGRYFFMKLPSFDFTKTWDDAKYWQSKNLTQDEIDLIERTVK
jgi:hypothetical protein